MTERDEVITVGGMEFSTDEFDEFVAPDGEVLPVLAAAVEAAQVRVERE